MRITITILLPFLTIAIVNSQYIVNDAFKKSTLALSNFSSSGTIGSAFETVDHYSSFTINQTTSSITLSLPDPNDPTDGDDVTIRNIGTVEFQMYNIYVYPDSFEIHLSWKNGAWLPVGAYATSSSSCPCCTDILYFDSDTAAYYQGRINKDEYYLTSASHLEGLGKGIYKQVPENYGWELWTTDSLSYGFGGLIVKSKNTTRVGFDATFLSPCRVQAPAVDLHYFDSNESAILGGLSVGDSYLLSQDNLRGLPKGFIQKITTP
jgi:hypothetical protein